MTVLLIILLLLFVWWFVFPIVRRVHDFKREMERLRTSMNGGRASGGSTSGTPKDKRPHYRGESEAEYVDFEDVPGKMESVAADDDAAQEEPIVTDAEFEELPPD